MSQEIIDLDAAGVLAAPKRIRLHGRVYTLPGDIPAALYVRIQQIATDPEAVTESSAAMALAEELLAAFRVYQPDLDRLPLGVAEMVSLVGAVYRGAVPVTVETDDAGPENDAAPPTRATRKRKPKPRATRRPTSST